MEGATWLPDGFGQVAPYLIVEDADATFARALAAGMTEIFAPADVPYQERQGGVRDDRGNIWWISQRLVEGGS